MIDKGNIPDGDTSLEERLNLNFVSEDPILKASLITPLQSEYNLHSSNLSDIIEGPVNKTSDIYIVDLLPLPATNYDTAIEKIKYIKAIRPESKVVVLATATQQANEDFASFKEAKKCCLIEVYSRDDPSQLAESNYVEQITDLSTKLPPFLDEICHKNGKLEHTKVIKIGGSIFDLYKERPQALRNLLKTIIEAHHNHGIILTVGGGPLQGFSEEYRRRLKLSNETYEQLSEAQLTGQAATLAGLLEQIKPGVVLPIPHIPSNIMEFILEYGIINKELLREKIPIISLLPRMEKLKVPEIPSYTSDVHTVYFADKIGVRKIIFAKYTDGIYLRDPNLPDKYLNKIKEGFRRENMFFEFIYAKNIQQSIERKGLNPNGEITDDHLIETPALESFIKSKNLYTIQIVNGTKPSEVVKAIESMKAGSYIIK